MTDLLSEILNADSATPTTMKRGAARPETDKERIDRQQASINKALGAGTVGVVGNGQNNQWYENGHETDNAAAKDKQDQHAREFTQKAGPVIDALADRVIAEGRRDVVTTAKDIAAALHINGKLTLDGKPVRAHAVEQMLYRADAGPAVKYVQHLKGLMVAESDAGTKEGISADERDAHLAAFRAEKAKFYEVIVHEMQRAGDKKIQLRTREGSIKDVYAAVGPDFGKADFPAHARNLKEKLGDTPAKAIYDAATTAWDLRGEVYTPTPAQLHKVGEPIRGGMSVRGADRGGKSIKTSGFLEMVRCCNYSLYQALVGGGNRAHRGKRVVESVAGDIATAVKAIDVMCDAWGVARTRKLAAPKDFTGTEAQLVAGTLRYALRDGALEGVVRGRTSDLVNEMLEAFDFERRNRDELVLSDLQQAVTRFSQKLAPEARAELDAAAGEWMVEVLGAPGAPIGFRA